MEDRYEAQGKEVRRETWEEREEFRDRVQGGQWVTGVLLAHGKANYRFDAEAEKSYYMRLRTRHGEEVLWGKGLEEAIAGSKSHVKVGQRVGARIIQKEPMILEKEGKREFVKRNHWEVETPAFVERRNRIAREILENPITARQRGSEHPEITGAYLALRGAQLLANVRYTDERDRQEFVKRVREAIGLPAEPFRARDTAASTPRANAQTPNTVPTTPNDREPYTR